MVMSMVVLLIPVAIIATLAWLGGGSDPVVTDPGPAIAEAQHDNAFPVAPPHGLSPDWRPVSAGYDPKGPGSPGAVLRIGYVTPSGGSLQLVESDAPKDGLLIRELGDNTTPQGVVSVATVDWDAFRVRNGEQALVRSTGARTLIVIGSAEPAELTTLAASTG